MPRKASNRLVAQIRRVNQIHDELDELAPVTRSLEDLRRLRDQVNQAIDAGIVQAKVEGLYWPAIGAALRISPQAVQQRFRSLDSATPSGSA